MKTVALRFSDNFAPEVSTIYEHEAVIEKNGFVWYGKFGAPLSETTIKEIMNGCVNNFSHICTANSKS